MEVISTGHEGSVQAIVLSHASPGLLDSLSLNDLFKAIKRAERSCEGRLPEPELNKLDSVYRVKFVRALQSWMHGDSEWASLDDHLARVATERNSEYLDSMPRRYASRWRAWRDLLSTAIELRVSQERSESTTPDAARNEVWELVAGMLSEAGSEGKPWKDVVAALDEHPSSGGRSKASRSILLNQLVTAGWVRAVPKGREKYVYSGPRIQQARSHQAVAATRAADVQAPAAAVNAHDHWANSLKVVRQHVCFSQGRLIEHFHLINSKHKHIRLSMEKLGQAGNHAPAKLAMFKFASYLQEEFALVAKSTFDALARHFEPRCAAGARPRICVKGNFSHSGVVDVLRSSNVHYSSTGATNFEENTGFLAVKDTGRYYLANDLPNLVLRDQYRNPRIDPARVHGVRERLRQSQPTGDLDLNWENWVTCWRDSSGQQPLDPSSCYRSTLIIPCTVWNNSLSDGFLGSIKRQLPELEDPSFQRMILGYLCMDHVDTGFFDPQLDIEVGYVMADILSIFLFSRWLLTEASDTFKNARTVLKLEKLLERWELMTKELTRLQPNDVTSVDTKNLTIDVPLMVNMGRPRRVQVADLEQYANSEELESLPA